MSWRSWSSANPCPVCSGHYWAGASAEQCRGGYNPELSEQRVWCSIEDSGKPSSTGITWEWWLDAPYPWIAKPRCKPSTAGFSDGASKVPYDLEREGGWKQTGEWWYRDTECEYRYSVFRFDWDGAHGPCPRSRTKEYRPGRRQRNARAPREYAYSGPNPMVHWGLPRDERIPYQLPRLGKAIELGLPVYIVEGEKSADAINALDIALRRHTATTLPGGSAQWNSAPEPHCRFAGAREVIVVVDRDTAGEGWARDVVASLRCLDPAPRIRLVRSRTTAPGDDVVDHLDGEFGLADLEPFNPNP